MIRKFLFTTFFVLIACQAQALGIYCPHCYKHLYEYEFDELDIDRTQAQYFRAVEAPENPKDTDRFICPFDETPLNGYEFWFWIRGLKPTEIRYPAITVLTKQGDKFVWHPYDVDLIE